MECLLGPLQVSSEAYVPWVALGLCQEHAVSREHFFIFWHGLLIYVAIAVVWICLVGSYFNRGYRLWWV